MLQFSKSDEETNSSTSWMAGGSSGVFTPGNPASLLALLQTKYNVDFGVVHFHTALFASEPEIVNMC